MQASDIHIELNLAEGKKIYFAGDFHLGMPDETKSREREQKICSWLDRIKNDAAAIFLMGDQFDFWFEHEYTVPKGFVRFLGKLAQLSDSGIKVFMFKGNHDMWTKGYWEHELGATVISDACMLACAGKKFYLHHGDGLGPGENGYKVLRKIFRAPWSSWLFARLHPNFGFAIARLWSRRSRLAQGSKYDYFLGNDKEILYQFCKEKAETTPFDYFIFGHRHVAMDLVVMDHVRYINTGTWFTNEPYAVFNGTDVILHKPEK